jgi:hypothetical protein
MKLKNTAQLTTPLSNFIAVTNTLSVSTTSSSVIHTFKWCEGEKQMRCTFIDLQFRVGFVLPWKQTTTSACVN